MEPKCEECNGDEVIDCEEDCGCDPDCERCQGDGYVDCPTCDGDGKQP